MDQALIQGSTSPASTSLAFLVMCRGIKRVCLVGWEEGGTSLLPVVSLCQVLLFVVEFLVEKGGKVISRAGLEHRK